MQPIKLESNALSDLYLSQKNKQTMIVAIFEPKSSRFTINTHLGWPETILSVTLNDDLRRLKSKSLKLKMGKDMVLTIIQNKIKWRILTRHIRKVSGLDIGLLTGERKLVK